MNLSLSRQVDGIRKSRERREVKSSTVYNHLTALGAYFGGELAFPLQRRESVKLSGFWQFQGGLHHKGRRNGKRRERLMEPCGKRINYPSDRSAQ